jgi:hypothetical protein
MKSARKIKVSYTQTYVKGTFVRMLSPVPPFSPMKLNSIVSDIELKAAGHCTIDGEPREFLDLRVYVIPPCVCGLPQNDHKHEKQPIDDADRLP